MFYINYPRTTSKMCFYRKNEVWTYEHLNAQSYDPLLLSDTTPDLSVSFWRTENPGHPPLPTPCGNLACGWHSGNVWKTKQATQVYSLFSSTICAFSPWQLCSQDFFNQKRPLFFFLFLYLFQFNLFLKMNSSITSLIKVTIWTSSDYPLVALTLYSESNCHNLVWICSATQQYRGCQKSSGKPVGWTSEYRSKTRGSYHSFTCENMSLHPDLSTGNMWWEH